jgi:polysaccharide biosynthesis transport protein
LNDYLPNSQGLTGRSDSSALSVREIIFVLYRRRLTILAVALPIMVIASLGLFNNVGSFVASCQILLDLQAPETPRWNTKAYVDYDRSLSTYRHMAMSVPVAKSAATSLLDSLSVIHSLDGGVFSGLTNKEDLTEFLLNGLDISPMGESSILAMRFGSSNPRLSLMAVKFSRDAFLKYTIGATKNSEAVAYYDEQVQIIRDEINSLLILRSAALRKAGFSSIKEDLRYISSQKAELRDRWFEEKAELRYLQSLAEAFRKASAEDSAFSPSPDRGRESAIMVGAKSNLEKVRQNLAMLRLKYTDDHVEVQRTLQLLANAEELLKKEVDAYIKSIEIDAEASADKASMLESQLTSMSESVSSAPEVEHHVSLLDMEVNALKNLLEDLQIKRGEVQLMQRADERINTIIKLTEPEIETVITGSRRIAYFLVISVFGLIFAVIVAFIIDYQDHRIYSPDKLQDQLGVPVLGSVSRVTERSSVP